MRNDQVIEVLNDLIGTSRNGEEGFRTCAEGVKNPSLKTLFDEYAASCAEAVRQLQQAVRSLGGDPDKSGTIAGAAHRAFVNIKSSITGMDEKAVIDECERGEDVAMAQYQDALKKELPPNIRTLIDKQYQGVRQHHDRISALKHRQEGRQARA